jgi:hypothetical protein
VPKIAIILQAGPGTHEALARAFHAMVYSKELKERGHEVRLVFNGASTGWLAKRARPEDESDVMMAGLLAELKEAGLAYSVCDFCSVSFGVHDELKEHGEPLVAEYMDYPSVADLVEQGYQVITL